MFKGTVGSLSPGTGAQFAILPPQNATGNFVKVVQRVPVRIYFDKDDKFVQKLKAGMSVYASIDTNHRRSLASLLGFSGSGPSGIDCHERAGSIAVGCTRPAPEHGDDLRHDGDHHAGARHHDRQRRPALYAGLAVGVSGPDQLGADLLHCSSRDHDSAGGLDSQPVRPQAHLHSVLRRFHGGVRLCGLAQDIDQMVLFRLLQGVFGAALVPLSQAVMLDSYTLQERAKAMAIWGMGVMMGPIMGPSLGAWLTETYSWHWVFFVNLPFGFFTVIGLMVFMDETRKNTNLRFDWFGFTALAISIGSLQLALDRGEQLGWLKFNEIIAEFIVAAVGCYYFFAHSLTTSRPFIQFALFKDRNFVTGCVFMAVMGLVLYSTMALASPYLQNVIGYPIITAGVLLASRGCGTFVAMMLVGRLMRHIEARTLSSRALA